VIYAIPEVRRTNNTLVNVFSEALHACLFGGRLSPGSPQRDGPRVAFDPIPHMASSRRDRSRVQDWIRPERAGATYLVLVALFEHADHATLEIDRPARGIDATAEITGLPWRVVADVYGDLKHALAWSGVWPRNEKLPDGTWQSIPSERAFSSLFLQSLIGPPQAYRRQRFDALRAKLERREKRERERPRSRPSRARAFVGLGTMPMVGSAFRAVVPPPPPPIETGADVEAAVVHGRAAGLATGAAFEASGLPGDRWAEFLRAWKRPPPE
jgi:hypothetical protein